MGQEDDNGSNDGVSKEARQSSVAKVTKVSKIAAVSPPVAVPETSRSIQTFGLQYDKLYAEFHQELVMEYAQMRGAYMGEYQGNYDQNTSRKDDKITEMNMAIQAKVNYINELESQEYMTLEFMQG